MGRLKHSRLANVRTRGQGENNPTLVRFDALKQEGPSRRRERMVRYSFFLDDQDR
jgi:hypothetical protein